MSNELIKEVVNIYELPEIDKTFLGGKNTNITIGDLHGNAIKLLFMLIKHGIASALSKEDYLNLVGIYKQNPQNITSEQLNTFNDLIAKIEIKSDASIILIGDVLADRGSNDYFTLKLLEKLHQGGAHVETLFSNHDAEFILAYETNTKLQAAPNMDHSGQVDSMNALQTLIERKLITFDSVISLVKSAYQPTLKALTYTLNDYQNEITIYSHAGIGLSNLQAIAEKLKVDYKDVDAIVLAKTIDAINSKFQEHVNDNKVHELATYEELSSLDSRQPEEIPIAHLMWNRRYDNLVRPEQKNDYNIKFVHGHDSHESTMGNIYNLDNKLGKFDISTGQYTVLYTTGEKLRLVNQDRLKSLDQDFINSKESKAFLTQIDELFKKASVFDIKGNKKPAEAALRISQALEKAFYYYATNPTDEQAKEAFKQSCQKQFNGPDRKELEAKRGAKKILVNLAIAMVGLIIGGIVFGLGNLGYTHGKHFFYHPKTDSALKIDALEQSIEKFAPHKK